MASITHTLVSGSADNITGLSADDDTFSGIFIQGDTGTWNLNDSVDGGTGGIDTLSITNSAGAVISPSDAGWKNLKNIEKIVISTTTGAQNITTGTDFNTAFAAGVDLVTTANAAGVITLAMSTFPGALKLTTTSVDAQNITTGSGSTTVNATSTSGAQDIVTGSGGATTVTAVSDGGAIDIKGISLTSVVATSTGGAQTIGNSGGSGANLISVTATSVGGAQTITSTSANAVTVAAISGAGKQIITTGAGNDVITAKTTAGSNTITTGVGNDKITIDSAASGVYTLDGGDGNDTLTSGAGADNLIGGLGDDLYDVIGADTVKEDSGAGTDTVNSSLAAYTLPANVENGRVMSTGAATLTGNGLNNILYVGTGNNTLDGGIGTDTAVYAGTQTSFTVAKTTSNGGYTITLKAAPNSVYTLSNIETLQFSDGSITPASSFIGTIVPSATAGNDTLVGTAGADTLAGLAGNDTYTVNHSGDVITEQPNEGTDTVESSITYSLPDNVENLTLTGTGNINGTGNALNNAITGNAGANIFNGGSGNDILTGGAGNDTYLFGIGSGQDTIVDYDTTAGNLDIVQLGSGVLPTTLTVSRSSTDLYLSIAGTTDKLTVSNWFVSDANKIEQVKFADGTIWDVAKLTTLANVQVATAGDDYFIGTTGADTFAGLAGNDTYVVDNIGDSVTEKLNEGTDKVEASITYTLPANVENLTLTGIAGINGTGNDLNNSLIGNAGANNLNGGLGDDILDGGAGNDLLDGGDGTDTAVYAGALADFTVQKTGVGAYTITAKTGILPLYVDTLSNIEKLQFTDTTLTPGSTLIGLIDNTTPVVTPPVDPVVNPPVVDPPVVNPPVTPPVTPPVIPSNIGITVTGDSADNTLTGTSGNDTINGMAGTDTAVYTGKLANYTLTRTVADLTVKDNVGNNGTDVLTNVEKVHFSDAVVNLTVQSKAATIPVSDLHRLEELYVGFFQRMPDADGLEYWIDQVKTGLSLNKIADFFYDVGVQYSTQTGYSASMTSTDFIKVVYNNILGRVGDAAPTANEIAFWDGPLASGLDTHGSIVNTMLDVSHNQYANDPTWGWVAKLLDNKTIVANLIAVEWGINYLTPEVSITQGMAIANVVTVDSTAAAITLIGLPGVFTGNGLIV